jgi:hypothetical protein
MRWSRRSRNWTSFSSPWARAWDGHEVVDLAVGGLALHNAEENPDEVLAALDDKTAANTASGNAMFTLLCPSELSVLHDLSFRYSVAAPLASFSAALARLPPDARSAAAMRHAR